MNRSSFITSNKAFEGCDNIVIVQLQDMHLELLPFVLQVLSGSNLPISIANGADSLMWIKFSERLAMRTLDRTNRFFDTASTLAIFLTHNEYIPFQNRIRAAKILTICHLPEQIGPLSSLNCSLSSICLSPIVSGKFIMPLVDFGGRPSASSFSFPELKYALVGSINSTNYDFSVLIKLLDICEDFTIEVYSKSIDSSFRAVVEQFPNRFVLNLSASANDLIDGLQTCKGVLLPFTRDSWYLRDRLSGIIPIASSLNLPLYSSPEFCALYSFLPSSVFKLEDLPHHVLNLKQKHRVSQPFDDLYHNRWLHSLHSSRLMILNEISGLFTKD